MKTRRSLSSSGVTLLKEKVLHFCSRNGNDSLMWVRASPRFDLLKCPAQGLCL